MHVGFGIDQDSISHKTVNTEVNPQLAEMITACIDWIQSAHMRPPLLVAAALTKLRGIANLLSKCLLSLVLKGQAREIIAKITTLLPENGGKQQGVELVVRTLDSLLADIVFGSHALGYYYYSQVVKELIACGIDQIFLGLHRNLLFCTQKHLEGHPNLLSAIEVTLQAMFKTLIFPFENTYVSYSTDSDLGQISQVNYPYRWTPHINNPHFLQTLVTFVLHSATSDELVVEGLRVLSIMSSGRLDPSTPEEIMNNFKRVMLNLGTQVLESFDSKRRKPPALVLELLIDQCARFSKVYSIMHLGKYRAHFERYLQAFATATAHIFQREPDVGFHFHHVDLQPDTLEHSQGRFRADSELRECFDLSG